MKVTPARRAVIAALSLLNADTFICASDINASAPPNPRFGRD